MSVSPRSGLEEWRAVKRYVVVKITYTEAGGALTLQATQRERIGKFLCLQHRVAARPGERKG